MPRNPKRKSEIGTFSEAVMTEAVQLVLSGRSLRSVAVEKNLSFQTLGRYVKKQKEAPNEIIRMTPNYSVNKVFSNNQEEELASYIVNCSKMFYGLPVVDCCKLAYELAAKNNLKFPKSWNANRKAGVEWFYGFMRRHSSISLRTPEGCSLARAISFNKHTANIFFCNLKDIYLRSESFSDGTRVFNLDETTTSTVQRPHKVIAQKGIKQVNVATSGEKGAHVTTCCFINAVGNSLPPAMIFPRVHFKEHMIAGAPAGTLGLANPSGWMTKELFVETMKHFIKHSHSSIDCPSLLIYDNHESHLSIVVLDLAKENGVTILTIPPHSSAKLQPLDVGVFGPFTSAYNAALYSWLLRHPGKNLSIYEVAYCVGDAHLKAMTPKNITAAFKKTGIFPFDDQIFTETDFMSSSVTYRQPPTPEQQDINNSILENVPCTSSVSHIQETENPTFKLSPVDVRGYPKASIDDRQKKRKERKKGKSIIATDTPIRDEIRKKRNIGIKKKEKVKKTLFHKESSTDEDDIEPQYIDSSDELEELNELPEPEELSMDPKIEDYILVKFETKKNHHVYYVGKVIKEKDENDDIEVSYLRKSLKIENNFCMPNVPDLASVPVKDVYSVLPSPNVLGATKRQQSYYSFPVNFSGFNIR